MSQIEWNADYHTGVGLLDGQNKHCIEMLNLLFELREDEPEPGLFYRMFCQTIDHLREHFQEEELFYERHAPRNADGHREQHQRFLETLTHFGSDAQDAETAASSSLCEYLRDWTVFHIQHFDKNTAFNINHAVGV